VTGCTDSVPFSIEAQGFPNDTIFNVFSPNNDGINDDFIFGEYGMENIDVQIFNRWGQEVYSWTGENKAWDGRGADGQDLPEGVYFFVFKADGIDGHYYEEKGSVTLLR
jgi:gliding motility-associated-like protein